MVPEELAQLYMSILANKIGDLEGVSSITDNPRLHKFSVFTRESNIANQTKINIAKSAIALHLPANLSNISINDIISLRNSDGFREKLNALHQSLDSYCLSIETGTNVHNFIESFDYSLLDFKVELLKLSPNLFNFALNIYTSINTNIEQPIKYLGYGLTFLSVSASTIKARKDYKKTQPKRFANKYLASLERIPVNDLKEFGKLL